ncbi:MAG: hypothetical protein Q7R93_03750 [bacterium]|nr:hypothetical protein [bacterium]
MLLKLVVGVVALGALATGGYFVVKENGVRALSKVLQDNLDSGDYLAALGAAGKIKESGKGSPELEQTVATAARLLVAEDIYHQAVKASDEKRFVDARALLTGSEAVHNPTFKYYEEAQALYKEAEALAAGAAHKTAVTISNLEEKAKTEQTKRQELEQNKKKLEGTLSEKEKSLSQSKAETADAKQKAEASQKDAEAKQVALQAEQTRTQALMEQVAKESKQKFFTELKTYRDMAQKGREQLDNAVIEIGAKRDVTALVYVKQGSSFFEDVKTKVADLRGSRTPAVYQSTVDDFVKSLEQFIEASKQFRNAVFFIDDQGSAEFTSGFSKGKTALANAISYLSSVSDPIAANP